MLQKNVLFFILVLVTFVANATKLTFTYVGNKPTENRIQILSYRTHDDFDLLKELQHKPNEKLTCELAFQKAQFLTIQIGYDQYEMYAEPEKSYEIEYEKRADNTIKMIFKDDLNTYLSNTYKFIAEYFEVIEDTAILVPKTLNLISNFKSNILTTYQSEQPELVEAEARKVIFIHYRFQARVLKYKPNVIPAELIEPFKELVDLNSIDLTTMSRTNTWFLRECFLGNQKKIFRVKYDGAYNELGFYFFAGKKWIENLNVKKEIAAYLLGDFISFYIRMPIELGENGEKEIKDFCKTNPESPHISFINSQLNLRLKTNKLELKAENEQKADFSYEDFNTPFLYVDFWATWCAPCVKEIPGLKLLESEYAGKISFVKCSIDEDADRWRKFSKDKKLTHSFILKEEEKEQTIKKYGTFDVPRYLIVDKTGRIINANAPRPSDPKLRELLDELLKE